jgi:predicted DCC family thiol-disulfide oxidoreductase YuxK
MTRKPDFPIRIFYDGSCIVCASEIEHYLRREHCGRLVAVDISSPEFNSEPFHIPLEKFMYELHVIDSTGTVYKGVEAFWAIWQAFPTSTVYGIMGAIVTAPVLNLLARLFYKGFANIRPYLPKRHVCDSGTCSIGKKR